MGISVFPAAAGGGIKLVQRGNATSSGNITITAVNTAKAFVTFVSQGSAGTVATDSVSTGTLSPSTGQIVTSYGNNNFGANTVGGFPTLSGTRTLSGGTMDATTKQMGVYLSNSTTLVATGACRWEVVEFA